MKGAALETAMERYGQIVSLNSLRVSSSGRPGGGAWKGRRACNYASGIWIPLLRLSCQISTHQLEAETSANVNKHYWKTRAKGNDVITNVIFVNQHFASTFYMQIFKFQRRSCKLSISCPGARAPRRPSPRARTLTAFEYVTKNIFSLTQEHELPVRKIPATKLYMSGWQNHRKRGEGWTNPDETISTDGIGPTQLASLPTQSPQIFTLASTASISHQKTIKWLNGKTTK